jgi:serine/threonine protein kinase
MLKFLVQILFHIRHRINPSHLNQIHDYKRSVDLSFPRSSLESIILPSTILFVSFDAFDTGAEIYLVKRHSCPEFYRWWELRKSGIPLDFRRILRVNSGLPSLRDYVVDLSEFKERSMIGDCNEVSNEIYDRVEDELLVVVKSIPLSECVEKSQLEHDIENLINLRHPCIASPIGFIFPIESGQHEALKIVQFYSECCSLAEVLSVRPSWWTSTMKAKVIAGIVLGLRFAHSLGLVHGHLSGNNIVLDSDHCIQIVDFDPIQLNVGEVQSEEGTQLGSFSRKGWTQKTDISAFASILFEIVVGRPAKGETSVPTNIRYFISRIIEIGL